MKSPITRIDYNPSVKEHRDSLFLFLKEGRWTNHFNIKFPYKELPYQLFLETLDYYRSQEKQMG